MEQQELIRKPLIFIGTGRSGTTFISNYIMSHPDLAFPSNYNVRFRKYPAINYLRNFFENQFWEINHFRSSHPLRKFTFKPAEAYPLWDFLTGPNTDFSRDFLLEKRADEDTKAFIKGYFANLVKLQNRKRLAFKITGPPRIGYLKSIFPDAQFVIIKRRLIPTINSFLKVNFWKSRGYSQLWWKGAYTKEEEEWVKNNAKSGHLITAFQIKRLYEVLNQELNKHQPDHLIINYEHFVAHPKFEAARILNFAGLHYENNFLEFLNGRIKCSNKEDEAYFEKQKLKQINKVLQKT